MLGVLVDVVAVRAGAACPCAGGGLAFHTVNDPIGEYVEPSYPVATGLLLRLLL
jgi:hypothetical protein